MNITDITSTLNARHSLKLDRDSLGDSAAALFQRLFMQESCTVSGGQVLALASDSVHFSGVIDQLFATTSVAIPAIDCELFIFEYADGNADPQRHCLIRLATDGLTLLQLLAHHDPQRAATIDTLLGAAELQVFEQLQLNGSACLFSSFAYAEEAGSQAPYPAPFISTLARDKVWRGINLRVSSQLHTELFPLEVLPLPDTYQFFATIQTGWRGRQLRLESDVSVSFQQEHFTFALQQVVLSLATDIPDPPLPEITLLGKLTAGSLHVDIEADLNLSWQRLHVGFGRVGLPSVADLETALGVDDLAGHFPLAADQLGQVAIEQCNIVLDLASPAVSSIDFAIRLEKGLAFTDRISFLPGLQARISAPLDKASRRTEALLTGVWQLGNSRLDVSMSVPDFQFSASLGIGSALDVSALTQQVLGDVPLPDIELLDLDVTGSFPQRSFDAEITVASDWSIDVGGTALLLEQLWMELSFAHSAVGRCMMSGQLRFAGHEFQITAEYDHGSGWGFSGGCRPVEQLSVTQWGQKLLAEWPGAQLDMHSVADEYTGISLKYLSLDYRSTPQDITFYAELDTALHLTGSFALELLFARFNFHAGQLTGALGAHFVLSSSNAEHPPLQFLLELDKQAQGWAFSGNSTPDVPIPIGQLLETVAEKFGDIELPAALQGMMVSDLAFSYATQSKAVAFTCSGMLPLSQHDSISVVVRLAMEQQAGDYHKAFSGHLVFRDTHLSAPLLFDLQFVADSSAGHSNSTLLATYSHPLGEPDLNLPQLVRGIAPNDQALAKLLPDSLDISIRDVLFAYVRTGQTAGGESQGYYLFSLEMGWQLGFSQLPLMGAIHALEQGIAVENFRVMLASADIAGQTLTALNPLLPTGLSPLPAGDAQATALAKGVSLSLKLRFDSNIQVLELPFAAATQAATSAANDDDGAEIVTAQADDGTKWLVLHKHFGPAHFERIGIRCQDSALWFLLDASLSLAGLTLTLEGLGVHSKLKPLHPVFSLSGLGLDYQGGPLEIGGMFLRETLPNPDDFAFDGLATLKTETLMLSALGSYAEKHGDKSLLVYAVLDYPLGGPAFFFVTGLTAGFGYNHEVRMPAVEKVGDFPLVSAARAGAAQLDAAGLQGALDALRRYLPSKTGQYFLAAGIKYTSFKLIDSFALLSVQLGGRFEVDLLGISALVLPTPLPGENVTPIAEMELAVKATFVPDEGFLGVQAQLTNHSYILSRKCRLTGGFAFFSWLSGSHAGDFVYTQGGYHPAFKVPAHYPKVPRLGFKWQVDEHLFLKGGMYYALTAGAMMAGGSLQAVWQKGSLKAVFDAGADFLLAWKPYHYDARLYVHIAGTATFWFFGTRHVTAHVGADLHVWGPEFAGTATVDLSVTSFTVSFGAARPHLQPIDWDSFKQSFLANGKENDWLSITVVAGLGDKVDGVDKSFVNIKALQLAVNSVIPIGNVQLDSRQHFSDSPPQGHTRCGIAPMGLPAHLVSSTLSLSVDGSGVQFSLQPVHKAVPVALWGESLLPDLHGKQLLEHTLAGVTLRPAKTSEGDKSHAIDRERLLNQVTALPKAFVVADAADFQLTHPSDPRATVAQQLGTNAQRDALLTAAGFDPANDVQLDPNRVAASLLWAPTTMRH